MSALYITTPSPQNVYVLKAEEIYQTVRRTNRERVNEKAFKTVFETLMTSAPPEHVLGAYPSVVTANPKSSYYNISRCRRGKKMSQPTSMARWRCVAMSSNAKALWTHPSISTRGKKCLQWRQHKRSDMRRKDVCIQWETWLISFLFYNACSKLRCLPLVTLCRSISCFPLWRRIALSNIFYGSIGFFWCSTENEMKHKKRFDRLRFTSFRCLLLMSKGTRILAKPAQGLRGRSEKPLRMHKV